MSAVEMVDPEVQVQQSIIKRKHDPLHNFPEQRCLQNPAHQHMRLQPQTPILAVSVVNIGRLPEG